MHCVYRLRPNVELVIDVGCSVFHLVLSTWYLIICCFTFLQVNRFVVYRFAIDFAFCRFHTIFFYELINKTVVKAVRR